MTSQTTTRRAALGALASLPAMAGATALPIALAAANTFEQEIARLIAAYGQAEREYHALADAHEQMERDDDFWAAEKQVDAAFTAWSDIFKAVLSAPCTTFEAVQMKANLLLSDKSSAFGGSLEYWESEMLLRSFVAVRS